MGTWMNNDGLFIKLGTSEAAQGVAGEYRTGGPTRMDEVTLTMTSLTTGPAIVDDNVFLPAGARIEKVEVVTTTASTGATAVLNVGLMRTDRSTVTAAGGLVAAMPLATVDTAGETTVLTVGATSAGTLIGTTLANVNYICADWDTAAFTAGKVLIRIFWSNPT